MVSRRWATQAGGPGPELEARRRYLRSTAMPRCSDCTKSVSRSPISTGSGAAFLRLSRLLGLLPPNQNPMPLKPPASVKAERVNPGIAPPDPGAVRSMAAKDAEIRKRQQDRADAQAKADKEQADAKKKIDMCAEARGRIRTLRDDVNVYRYKEKGEKVFFEPAERQKAIADNEKMIRDLNCPARPPPT